MPLSSDLIARFAAIVGDRHAIADPAEQGPYLTEWRGRYKGATPLVLRPGSTAEVSAILTLASETRTPIVPQGGNTGLVGGQIPHQTGDEIVLSLRRLDRIRAIDPIGNTLDVEAGATLKQAQDAALAAERLFPLSLASEGSATVGGAIATNAGGMAVIAHGSMRDLVLGLEVVLADGRIWNGMRHLRKDNAGYDLRGLIAGSEGTLGVVTAAVLKLVSRPRAVATVLFGLADPPAALALLALLQRRLAVARFELMPRIGLDFVLRHAPGSRDPMAGRQAWYAVADLHPASDDPDIVEDLLAEALAVSGVRDAVIASSLAQGQAFWRLREALSEVQRHEGGSIKHDVSVPIARIPEFLERAEAAVTDVIPGCRPVAFGHVGDGNIHFNVSQPAGADKAAFLARWDAVSERVHAIVIELGGSIAAEHGIGQAKRHLLPQVKDGVELDLMRKLKTALDPHGILNPGKVL